MYTFLLVLLILLSLVLAVAILLQAGKGGGLAASFGGASSSADSLIGTRQAGNLLTRVSWWGGGAFLFLAFVLGLMSISRRVPTSILDQLPGPAPATTPPTGSAPLPVTPKASEVPAPTPVPKQP